MKIIITNTFEKKYLKNFYKYFSINEFSEKLKNYKNSITLKYPHLKIKLKIKSVEFRGVILIKDSKYIIPIIFCLKKDKNCGENIMWSTFEKEILSNEEKILNDILNKNYKIL